MRCIYDKTIDCVINPDGPRTKDFECLGCYKPEGGTAKNEGTKKKRRTKKRNKISGKGRGRGRKVNVPKKKVRRGYRNK